MFAFFNNTRSYWLSLVCCITLISCNRLTDSITEEDQSLNRKLFEMFLSSNFRAEAELPEKFILTTYSKTYYKWLLKKERRVKMKFSDNPDFKATVFDTQDSQLHVVFCELQTDKPICNAIDSVNRLVWGLDSSDSILVQQQKHSGESFDGRWYLNSKTIGGFCKGKIHEAKGKRLLVYYMTKEYNDDKREMSALGNSVLNTIEFF